MTGTHLLRRTAATQANDVTGDFFAVSQLLDHSSAKITERYVKRLPSQKRKVADALGGCLDRALAGALPSLVKTEVSNAA